MHTVEKKVLFWIQVIFPFKLNKANELLSEELVSYLKPETVPTSWNDRKWKIPISISIGIFLCDISWKIFQQCYYS